MGISADNVVTVYDDGVLVAEHDYADWDPYNNVPFKMAIEVQGSNQPDFVRVESRARNAQSGVDGREGDDVAEMINQSDGTFGGSFEGRNGDDTFRFINEGRGLAGFAATGGNGDDSVYAQGALAYFNVFEGGNGNDRLTVETDTLFAQIDFMGGRGTDILTFNGVSQIV